ncbi:MAG: hypothetical protein D6731_08800 [Planctomycetota bacterium]|nr:MAG: hypothetical protein D6731_08800 [Planctomycetota bacterium]
MRRAASFLLMAWLCWSVPGCASRAHTLDRRPDLEDAPRCYAEAQELEARALTLIDRANRYRDERRRREHLDRALELLREARQLYEDELVAGPEGELQRTTCEQELERLSDRIAGLVRERPARPAR